MNMSKVYVTYQTLYGESEHSNPDAESIYDDYVITQVEYILGEAFLERPENPYHDIIEVKLPKRLPPQLACVVVRYADGGTFGSTEGYGAIAGVFTDYDEAVKLAAALEKDPMADGVRDQVYQFRAWTGYFARILSVSVHFVTLHPKKKTKRAEKK